MTAAIGIFRVSGHILISRPLVEAMPFISY